MQLIRFELNSILTHQTQTYQTQTHQTRLIKFELNYIQLIKLDSNRFNLSNLTQLLSQLDYIQLHLAQLNSTFQTRRFKLDSSDLNSSNSTY